MTITDRIGFARNTALVQTIRDLVLLVVRVGLGVIMVAHAKLEYDFGGSLAGVGRLFAQAGVPCPPSPDRPTCSSNSSAASR